MNIEKKIRKRIIANLPYFKTYVFISFIISVFVHLLSLMPAIFMQKVIDEYIPENNMYSIGVACLIFTGIPIFSTALSTLYNYFINIVGRKAGQQLSLWAFEKLLYQPISYFDTQNSTELSSYCKSEANKYVVFLLLDLPSLFANICSGLFIYLYLFKISFPIAIMTIMAVPFAILPSLFISKSIDKYVKKIVNSNAKLLQIMSESFKGIRLIKSYNLENDRLERMESVNKGIVKIWSKTAALDNLHGSWINGFSNSLFIGSIFLVSIFLIIKNELSIGVLVVILTYLPKIFSIISNTAGLNFSFKKQLAEFDKLFSIINMDDERKNGNSHNKFEFNNEITFNNVVFSYSKERGNVLNGLNLKVKKSEWLGIVGKSGAGKSTIFDLLLRFYECDEGNIKIDNTDIKLIDKLQLREKIILVSQEPFLFSGTLGDNLRMSNKKVSDSDIIAIINEVGLKEFFEKLPHGLDTELGENGIQLSGGEKQRFSLAQGLLKEGEILLLDEVTANVDRKNEYEIKETINKLKKNRKLTIISISHKYEFLDYADTIVTVDNGTVSKFDLLK